MLAACVSCRRPQLHSVNCVLCFSLFLGTVEIFSCVHIAVEGYTYSKYFMMTQCIHFQDAGVFRHNVYFMSVAACLI